MSKTSLLSGSSAPRRLPWYVRSVARTWTCAPPPAEVRDFHAGLPGYAPTPLTELPAHGPNAADLSPPPDSRPDSPEPGCRCRTDTRHCLCTPGSGARSD
ncbi:hypothetical protein R6V09_52600, partial [Streptomyces sp. W16]|nr:hypothetical protein [Streptomyces sp. W16]